MGYRDRDAFNAILSALDSTGAFAEVLIADPLDVSSLAASMLPLAAVAPAGWSEVADSNPGQALRKVAFTVALIARDDDPTERFSTLDLLSSIAANALDGSDLGGGCIAASTRLVQGEYLPGKSRPEGQLALTGSFAYAVALVDGHDTTP